MDVMPRIAWAVGWQQRQAGIGVPLGIYPAQLSMYLCGSALTQGTEGRLVQIPPVPYSGAEEAAVAGRGC